MREILVFLAIITAFCKPCWARVDLASTKPLVIPVDKYTPRITSEDVAKYIPLDIKRTDSTDKVLTRIVDRTFNRWLKSTAVQNSGLGKAIEKTQETLKTDVEIKSADPEAVSHKVTVKADLFQTEAVVEYRGLVHAQMQYNFGNSESSVEISDKILEDKNLVISYKNTQEQALSMIGLAWSW